MRKKRTPIEVFSLSFLDIISCAFGAVVMLILLSKNGDQAEYNDMGDLMKLLATEGNKQAQIEELEAMLTARNQQLTAALAQSASNADDQQQLETDVARAQRDLTQLTDQASGLEDTLEQRKRAAINAPKAQERDEEVGGIPVDSDYVVFIIDTSGSMKDMWKRVTKTIDNVLNNHPKVKGFQIMSDNGEILGNRSAKEWRKDTVRQRKAALKRIQNWLGSSNSSPVEGIERALRLYKSHAGELALYVFGDDYRAGDYDKTVEKVTAMNRKGKQVIARIHAIGFKNGPGRNNSMEEFSTFMREVARRNNGTFLAM